MKNFFKKIAFVLALALVLTNIGPVAGVNAATAPSLKYASRVIYVGGDALGDYSDNCWTPSQNTEGYTVKYSTKSTIIDVAKNGKITANGTGIGAAVVTVTYSKAGAKDITANFTVKVRRNAETVRLANASAALLEEAMNVGDTLELTAAKSINGSYAKGNYGLNNYMGVCSDQLVLVSSDEEVVKVEGMKITAVAAGEATITVKAMQYAQNKETGVVSKAYDVVVIGGMSSIQQTKANEFVVMMGKDIESIAAADFTIVQDSTNITVPVKEAKVDSTNKKKVTVTTYNNVTDGKDYTITYDEKNLGFKATDGVVVDIVIKTPTVPYETATEVKADLVDANGIVLDTVSAGKTNVDYTIETTQGYVSGDGKLVLWAIGNTAKLTVNYHTNKYDNETGAEIGAVKKEFTITAVEQTAVVAGDLKYSVAKEEPKWDSFTVNTQLAIGDTGYSVFAYAKNSDDTDATQTGNYTLESSNTNVLIVDPASNSSEKGIKSNITAVGGAGTTAYVIVKKGSTVVASIPVAIKAERKLNNIELDKYSASLSNAVAVTDTATVTLTFRDQYGDKMSAQNFSVSNITRPSGQAEVTTGAGFTSTESSKVTFGASGLAAGSYQFKITSGDYSKIFVLTVQNPGVGTATYKLILDKTSVDLLYDADHDTDLSVTAKVGVYKGGVLVEYLNVASFSAITVKKGSDNIVDLSSDGSGSISDDADSTITVKTRVTSSGAIYKAATGSYTIAVTVTQGATDATLTAGFNVTDTQPALTVSDVLKKTNVEGTVATTYSEFVKDAFTFYYKGTDVTADVGVVTVNSPNRGSELTGGDSSIASGSVAIKEIVVTYSINANNVTFTVPVNKTVNFTSN